MKTVVVFKGTCKNNWVKQVRISYCPKMTSATAQLCLFVVPHQRIGVFDEQSWGEPAFLCRKRKPPIHFASFFSYKMEEGHLHSNSILKRSITYLHCLRWRTVMLFCIAPLLPAQTICFRESWGQIFCCTSFPFMVSGVLHPFPCSVCLIPRFTHKMKMQQSCTCQVSLLPVGPLKSAGFRLF